MQGLLSWMLWYIWLMVVGLAAAPLAWRLFPALPGRGWPYRRALGLLLWGYAFWLPGVLGWTPNAPAAMLSALALVVGLSLWALRGRWSRFRAWMKAHRAYLLWTEGVFLTAFALWALVRAANPDIVGTEKPMELAFINATLRSPTLPPHDPWLSGYAISYYYFGYLLVAMLARLSGTPGPVAFNLALAMIFALAAEVLFGLVLDFAWPWVTRRRTGRPFYPAGLLGPLFGLLVGNWEGLLEVLHRRGLFWSRLPDGTWVSRFWTWAQIEALTQPPRLPLQWVPDRFWWWWQASRTVKDFTLTGQPIEVIDEFPFFSFLLGDVHPHVLSIPFVLLWVAWTYNLFRGGARGRGPGGMAFPHLMVTVLLAGGLAFLNAWDFPMAVALGFLALVVRWRHQGRPWKTVLQRALGMAVLWVGAALLAYAPFHWSFSSQVKGVLPNLLHPTRGFHLWVMFGPLLVPLFLTLGGWVRALNLPWREVARRGWLPALGLWVGLFLLSWFMAWAGLLFIPQSLQWLDTLGVPDLPSLVRASLARHGAYVASPLTLTALIGLALVVALRARRSRAMAFLALVAAWAAVLVLIPNHLYVWDHFGTRMNTVFKLYYQAWWLWAVVAAVGTLWGWRYRWTWRRNLSWLADGLWFLALAAGLVYTVLALPNKTNNFRPPEGWTLDGSAYWRRAEPDEWAAAQYLWQAPLGTVAEAVGGSYTAYARMATYSGQANVLGWPGHEIQWRGTAEPLGSREADMARLFTTTSWAEAQAILNRYGVRYVVVGRWERTKYQARETLFREHLPVLFQQGSVVIFGYDTLP